VSKQFNKVKFLIELVSVLP